MALLLAMNKCCDSLIKDLNLSTKQQLKIYYSINRLRNKHLMRALHDNRQRQNKILYNQMETSRNQQNKNIKEIIATKK